MFTLRPAVDPATVAAATERELARKISAGTRAATIDALAAARAHLNAAFPNAGGRMGRLIDAYWPDETEDAAGGPAPVAGIFARGKRAERILQAWTEGAVIRGRAGNWLAIPTDAVPYGQGRARARLKPWQVEQRLGRPLRWIASPDRRFGLLVMDGLTRARSGHGYREATERRRSQGRAAESVVMFVLIRQTEIPRRIDLEPVVRAVFDRIGDYIERA